LQLAKALRHAPAQSSPGVGLLGLLDDVTGGVADGTLGASPVALTRVAMGGGEACTLVGAGTTR
jgi:hypothetical protein